MKKLITLFLFLFLCISVFAKPKMEGTTNELKTYFNQIDRMVIIDATASRKIPYSNSVMRLSINTEAKTLAEALESNSLIRKRIRDQLQSAGIKEKSIKESKFSSTPEYSIFDDEPNAYKVENSFTIVVISEYQMIKVASVSDKEKYVHYISSKPEIDNQPKIKADLLIEALAIVKNKAKIYQNQLNIKLTPESVEESSFNAFESNQTSSMRSTKFSSYSSNQPSTAKIGEMTFTISIRVKYKLMPK